jgi:ATP diphosphatase
MGLPHTQELLAIMAKLRNPDGGCPWDLQQDFRSIAPYTIEEAYEVADAIAKGDMAHLREELGDLLLQVVFHSQMAKEAGHFSFEDVAEGIAEKMVRRHPHVFGDKDIATAEAQTAHWEQLKAQERAAKGGKNDESLLADVPVALPATMRAQKLQTRAASVGFDWPDIAGVVAKCREELDELEAAHASGNNAHTAEELGDVLFSMVNLARFMEVDAEEALRAANQKFIQRFGYMEQQLKAQDKAMEACSLAELEALWNDAKNI